MKPREFVLSTETKIFLGKDENSNDELMKKFKGKENVILHTVAPGSPFCVIEKLNPTKEEVYEAGTFCALKSQDWRDNKRDIKMHIFTGRDTKKTLFLKPGSWKLKNTPKEIVIKKKDILSLGGKSKK
ncbi:DUF814 domain-containing protein [archaeon]|nr:DUF814 domain-containing protein [archaeon]PJC45364.1 MAG: hypothetical protein CO037_01835 [Candidatus Pacearchaeota archaeon CG_4_9_14_0_2_um_filter_30_8]